MEIFLIYASQRQPAHHAAGGGQPALCLGTWNMHAMDPSLEAKCCCTQMGQRLFCACSPHALVQHVHWHNSPLIVTSHKCSCMLLVVCAG
jgi:hypothetical protein